MVDGRDDGGYETGGKEAGIGCEKETVSSQGYGGDGWFDTVILPAANQPPAVSYYSRCFPYIHLPLPSVADVQHGSAEGNSSRM